MEVEETFLFDPFVNFSLVKPNFLNEILSSKNFVAKLRIGGVSWSLFLWEKILGCGKNKIKAWNSTISKFLWIATLSKNTESKKIKLKFWAFSNWIKLLLLTQIATIMELHWNRNRVNTWKKMGIVQHEKRKLPELVLSSWFQNSF